MGRRKPESPQAPTIKPITALAMATIIICISSPPFYKAPDKAGKYPIVLIKLEKALWNFSTLYIIAKAL